MGNEPETRDGLRSESQHKISDNPSVQQLFNVVSQAIFNTSQPSHLSFENVSESVGRSVFDSLDQTPEIEAVCPRMAYNSQTETLDINVMRTFTHDCHQNFLIDEVKTRMVASQFLTAAESSNLVISSGTTFDGFRAPYAASRKQPDLSIVPRGQYFPSIVVESGWTESLTRLHQDMHLWLIGGRGQVQLVLLLKWTKIAGNHVRGLVEVWGLDEEGNEQLLQAANIFPVPTGASQLIQITRKQLFSTMLPQGRNPTDIWDVSLAAFRREAIESLQIDGYHPADEGSSITNHETMNG